MAYYHICTDCGAHLDPDEECDCRLNNEEDDEFYENEVDKAAYAELQRV